MAVSYVAAGTTSTGAGGSRGPSLPAGTITDDLLIVSAGARTDAGTYAHPTAGWTELSGSPIRSGNKNTVQHFWKFHDGSESVSALTYTTGEDGANESQAAQYAAFRGVDQTNTFLLGTAYTQTGVQDITWGQGVSVPDGAAVIYVGHKSDDWTGVTTFSGDGTGLTWNEIGEPDTTTGNDAGLVWGYAINSTGSTVVIGGSGSATVSGGAGANTLAYFIVLYPVGYTGGVTGAASITEASDTASAAATLALKASASLTEASDTLSAAGALPIVGQAAITEASDTLASLAGAVANTGSAALTEDSDTLSASGAVALKAAATITEAGDTLASAAALSIKAQAALTEASDTLASATKLRIAAAAGLTEADDTATSASVLRIKAAATLTEDSDTLFANASPPRIASAAVLEDSDTLIAAGVRVIFAPPLSSDSATAGALSSTTVTAGSLSAGSVTAGALSPTTGIIAPPLSSQEV